MTYTVFILRRAQKELGQLPREAYERARDAMVGASVLAIIASFTKLTTSNGS